MSNKSSLTCSHIFNEDAIDILRFKLNDCDKPEEFLHLVDSMANDTRYLIALDQPIQFPNDLSIGDDGSNAVEVYEAIGSLDRANAADPRLWSYLSMVTFRQYTELRWPLAGREKFKPYALDHWLMVNSSPRSLMRNSIARLWWTADLTYDQEIEHPYSVKTGDPFAYTRWVLANENRRQSIFERQIGRSPRLMWAVLEAMQEKHLEGTKDRSKALLKHVYLHTGYQRLEMLPDEELRETVSQLLDEVVEE